MKRLHSALLAAAALAFAPSAANAALAIGAKAPDFSTRGALAGKVIPIRLSTELKKGPVVLYFFRAGFLEFAEHIDARPAFSQAVPVA